MTMADVFMPEELWDVRRVARTLGVSTGTIRRYTKEGKLRATKLADQVIRYNPLDVEAFINRGEQRIRAEVEARKIRAELELIGV